ncbi:ADOP family duplicated permease [Terriglobus albidus]|uniref:ADOP family duplicated permease n=1 Tax=Terriglobus albidus TaxID=1592106 RepID=UPI0021DFD9F8|nr:ADOP family duplicated permease [Terriglobus albidus]
MFTLFHDFSFARRQITRHYTYALTAILSMALGIGATTAVYSVLYGVLIDPYPYRDADRIAFVTVQNKQGFGRDIPLTLSELYQLRQARSVEDAFAQNDASMVATDGDIPQSVKVLEMTGNGLQFLGAPPVMGRIFTASEAPAGVAPPQVAVISYLFWKSHFASNPNVIGKDLDLNHRKYTIVGVVGPRFTWHDSDVYVPMPAGIDPKSRFQTLIRLQSGISTAAAGGELAGFVQQVSRTEPTLLPRDGYRLKVDTLNDWILGQFKGTLFVLFVAVALLLLIGCGNVSILMLARGTARSQEIATRVALGASRRRIMQQLLTEAVILSVAGGVLGVVFAHLSIRLITGLIPEYSIPHEVVITLNTPVLLFSTAVSIAIGILAGISPALQFSNPHISQIIQSAGSRSTASHGARTRSVLIVGQTALTVLMLAGAGAAMRNFLQAYAAQLGFDPHQVLTLRVNLPDNSFPGWQERVNYYDAVIEKIKTTPEVTAASVSAVGIPPDSNWVQPVQIVGSAPDPSRTTGVNLIDSDYFAVLHIPLLEGRVLTREEVLHGAHLAVISKTFAQHYFPGSDPIGKQIIPEQLSRVPRNLLQAPNISQPFQVVGVVGDVRNAGLHRPILPQAYIPSSILVGQGASILIRTTANNPATLLHAISANIRTLNQNQAVSFVYSMDEYLSTFVWSHERFIAALFSVFSAIALALAAIGLASVVAYSVEQRTREIGIRSALGAPRLSVLLLTMTSTARTTGVGLVLGILLSIGLSDAVHRWTQSSLRDVSVLAVIAGIFLFASAIACILPARRAILIDPVRALRDN